MKGQPLIRGGILNNLGCAGCSAMDSFMTGTDASGAIIILLSDDIYNTFDK